MYCINTCRMTSLVMILRVCPHHYFIRCSNQSLNIHYTELSRHTEKMLSFYMWLNLAHRYVKYFAVYFDGFSICNVILNAKLSCCVFLDCEHYRLASYIYVSQTKFVFLHLPAETYCIGTCSQHVTD